MRPVENQWRTNVYDPANDIETGFNLLQNYNYSSTETKDIKNYTQNLLSQLFGGRCTKICLKSETKDYGNCVSNCYSKLVASGKIYEKIFNETDEKFQSYKSAGINYFA
jgi:hypothetical protein